jgi:hypothetical protein
VCTGSSDCVQEVICGDLCRMHEAWLLKWACRWSAYCAGGLHTVQVVCIQCRWSAYCTGGLHTVHTVCRHMRSSEVLQCHGWWWELSLCTVYLKVSVHGNTVCIVQSFPVQGLSDWCPYLLVRVFDQLALSRAHVLQCFFLFVLFDFECLLQSSVLNDGYSALLSDDL